MLRGYLLSHIDSLLAPDDDVTQKQAQTWYDLLMSRSVPEKLHPADPDNAVQRIRSDYESWYASLRDQGVNNPESLTIYRFYAQLDFVSKKIAAANPAAPNHE